MTPPRIWTPRPSTFAGLALALLAAPAAGQSATDTVAPPPPTAADSAIYALAVDSSAFPDQETILLLDEGRVRVEDDGSTSTTFRMVRQLRSDAAARSAAELSLSYDGERERLTLDWARVVDRTGRVLNGAVHVQRMDAPVSSASPVFTDGRVLRASLGGLEADRIVDVQYTRTSLAPVLRDDLYQTWRVNPGPPVLRSRLILDTPSDFDPRLVETNLTRPATVTRDGDRVLREWRYEDLAPIDPEPLAADSNDVAMGIGIGGPITWDDVAAWYASLVADRSGLTPAVRSAVAGEVDDAGTLRDSLRAVHRWVAQDIRYVSLSLGIGGYRPRPAEEVVRTAVGDCKDKTMLFVTVARAFGVDARPVLVRTSGAVEPKLPTPQQFDHMVAAIRLDGDWHYLDMTVPFSPFDEVFAGIEGKAGIMLHPDGRGEQVAIPQRPIGENRSVIRVTGELLEEGTLLAEYEETVSGGLQYRIRSEFASPLDARRRGAVERNLANRVARDATTDSVRLFDGLDLRATPRLWASVRAEGVLQPVGDAWLLPLRLPNYSASELIQRLEADEERRFPMDAGKLFGRRRHETRYRIRLPQGWTAELPDDVRAESPFGAYESSYEQAGRELRIIRIIQGTDAVLPATAVDALVAWLRDVGEDRVEHIVLRPPDR